MIQYDTSTKQRLRKIENDNPNYFHSFIASSKFVVYPP